jgi:hypothetical protein
MPRSPSPRSGTPKISVSQVLQQARSGGVAGTGALSASRSGAPGGAAASASGPAAVQLSGSATTAAAFSTQRRVMMRRRAGVPARGVAGGVAGSGAGGGSSGGSGGRSAGTLDQKALAAELGTAAPIGPAVVELLGLAFRANVPAILIGAHGLGKSEITAAAAASIGIDCISRDLSLMEPPDLVGLPKMDGEATRFLPPEFLPRETGRGGFLLIEEINRAPRHMQACCLELLTSRRLNSYSLPEKWLPVACVNPHSEGYHVDLLDAALMSRFMRIEVCAAIGPWVAWAQEHSVHPKIIEYVETVPNALDESQGGSNPRSWAYASRTLVAAGPEMLERSPDTLVTAINGLIGPVHTTALLRLILGTEVALTPSDLIHNWPSSRSMMKRWIREGRLDLLAGSMRAVLRWLRPEAVAEQLRNNHRERLFVRSFLKLLPGDLSEQASSVLHELGYTFLLPDVPDVTGH